MGLTVHHLGVSQSERVVWLCEELGIPYELKIYKRSPVFAPAEYKALHPVGSAPVIQDGPDVTLAESSACVEYICQTYGDGRLIVKPGEKNYADYLYWFHFATGTFVSGMMRVGSMVASGVSPESPMVQAASLKNKKMLQMLDDRLGHVPYLAGDELTAADIMNFVCLTTLRCFVSTDLTGFDNILAYLKRVGGREAYRRAMAKGDPELNIDEVLGAESPPMFPAYKTLGKK